MSREETLNEEWKPTINPWLSALSVMLTTFMVVLDSSIANVAIPKIAGSFSATQTESMWVITSYLVASGVILPSAGWFSNRFGRKKFLIICTILFTVSSLFCGVSSSMGMLITARVLQGIGGGALIPIAQAIMLESFPEEKRGAAMSLFGLGLIFAPIIGPTLGGWITDTYSWHWIFLINLPVGILSLVLCKYFIEDPPYAKRNKTIKMDYIGFGLLIVWLFSMQIVLDNGEKSDWFGSAWVRWMSLLSLLSLIAFVWWETKCKEPLLSLKLFLDKNFTVGTWLSLFVGAILYSTLAILPLFLQHLLGYTATISGLAISPRGIGSIAGIALCAIVSEKYDLRYLIAIGFLLLGLSGLAFGYLNLNISIMNIILPNILCGLGFGMIMVPLSTITFTTLKNSQMTTGTGIFSLVRSVGGAIGISLVTTMISRKAQAHQAMLVKSLSVGNVVFNEKLAALQNAFAIHYGQTVAEQKANFILYAQMLKQANLLAFMDCFRIFGILSFILIPLVFLFSKNKKKKHQKQPELIID